jgi:DNA-binding CsgD family transcriptional regulator
MINATTAQNSERTPRTQDWGHRTGALTGRALLVLQLSAQGYSPAQVARLLSMHEDERARYERSACATLGAQDTREAIGKARRRGLIL